LKAAAQLLEDAGLFVCEFPLFRYAHDAHDKTPQYMQMFLDHIEKENVDMVLFWCHQFADVQDYVLFCDEIALKKSIVLALFNWDDPNCWTNDDLNMPLRASKLHLVFTACADRVSNYLSHGTQKALYLHPPVDPEVHKIMPSSTRNCDVCIVVNTLYAHGFKKQKVSRKQIVDALCSPQSGLHVHVYGPEFLRDLYPRQYQGFAPYEELSLIYSGAKLSLTTHVDAQCKGYLNERCFHVAASQGLLWIDHAKDTWINESNAVFLDVHDPCGQARSIVKNYFMYQPKREKLHQDYLKLPSWGQVIKRELALFKLTQDPLEYKSINALHDPEQNLSRSEHVKQHWETYGAFNDMAPCMLKIPPHFDMATLIRRNLFSESKFSNSAHLAWVYWCHHRKELKSGFVLASSAKKPLAVSTGGMQPAKISQHQVELMHWLYQFQHQGDFASLITFAEKVNMTLEDKQFFRRWTGNQEDLQKDHTEALQNGKKVNELLENFLSLRK
jgi:hypothetical protein